MLLRIGLIPPDAKISVRAREVARKMGIEQALTIREGIGDAAVLSASEFEREGVDVIITRGITIDSVRKGGSTPVAEIPVTGQDIAEALIGAKKLTRLERPRIALMSFASSEHGVEALAELLDLDLSVYKIRNDTGFIREEIRRARLAGADVVVAGTISRGLAEEQGIPAIMLDAGEIALKIAFQNALNVAYARRLEKMRTRRLQSVVDLSQNGVVVLDAEGKVQAVNVKARQILRVGPDLEGAKAEDVLPEPFLSRCLSCKESFVDEMFEINGTTLLLSADITRLGGNPLDIIYSLQPVAAIGELESKLRKSLPSRGLTCQYSFADIRGSSPVLHGAIAMARSFAAADSPVLITGETGTGKELFAQAIHMASPFSSGPFVAINCAALPPSLVESELFGHEAGAFTGARRNGKPGLFEIAHNGTIFLDEVTEMDHYGQTRLLRVLQERCTMRIGGDKYIPVTARVLAASNQDLPRQVEKGGFRKDLYYRLNVLPLTIPPLRERVGDVPLLARYFAGVFRSRYGGNLLLTPEILEILEAYEWPGNVRELMGIIERLTLTARTRAATAAQVSAMLASGYLPAAEPFNEGLEGCGAGCGVSERRRIIEALEKNGGHQARAAEFLGMHRTTLARKMRAMNIQLCRKAV